MLLGGGKKGERKITPGAVRCNCKKLILPFPSCRIHGTLNRFLPKPCMMMRCFSVPDFMLNSSMFPRFISAKLDETRASLQKKKGGIGRRGSRTAVSTRKSDMAIQVVYPPFPPPCSVDCPFYVLLSPKVEVSAIRFFDGLPPLLSRRKSRLFSAKKCRTRGPFFFAIPFSRGQLTLAALFPSGSELPPCLPLFRRPPLGGGSGVHGWTGI